jgi:uncharacterized membrane protein
MKRIETRVDSERKKRRNQIILGVVMIFILVISTVGFALLSNSGENSVVLKESEISGVRFYFDENVWVGQLNNKNHAFFFLPEELEDIEINMTNRKANYINQPLYWVHSSKSINQLQYNLFPEYILRLNGACIEGENCEDETLPIKNCSVDNIVIFSESEENTEVYQREKCVYIKGNLVKGTDKFLYRVLEIV